MRILHIEDDALTARAVGRALTRSGHTVVNVTTAEAAIAALQHGGYDVVLSDFNIEGGTAGEVVAWANYSAPEILVHWVWLTSDEMAMEYLVAPFLQKPAPIHSVVAALAAVMS